MVGTSPDHIGHVLRFLVHSSGPKNRTLRRLLAHKHLNRAGLGKLTIQLVELFWVLPKNTKNILTQDLNVQNTHLKGNSFKDLNSNSDPNFYSFLKKITN